MTRNASPPQRDTVISLRLTVAEKTEIDAQAAACGLTTSEYIRRRIHGHTVTPPPPKVDEQAISLLRQQGGLIKQIFKHGLADPRETWAALIDIHATLAWIRDRGGK